MSYTRVSVNHKAEDWSFGESVPHSCCPTRHAQAEGCVPQWGFPQASLRLLASAAPLARPWHSLLQSRRREAGCWLSAAAHFERKALQKLSGIPASIWETPTITKWSRQWIFIHSTTEKNKVNLTLLKVIQNFIFVIQYSLHTRTSTRFFLKRKKHICPLNQKKEQ